MSLNFNLFIFIEVFKMNITKKKFSQKLQKKYSFDLYIYIQNLFKKLIIVNI